MHISEEHQTRQQIIVLLRKNGVMSIEGMSKSLGITPMGVRQHLIALEKKGIVTYETRRQSIGRPGFLYQLTKEADDLFPKAYYKFVNGLLKDIETHYGKQKIKKLFQWRAQRILSDRENALKGKPLNSRINALIAMLNEEGYLAEYNETADGFVIKQYNCPIYRIASEFPIACKYEIDIYKKLLGINITRVSCISRGATACEYLVPKGMN